MFTYLSSSKKVSSVPPGSFFRLIFHKITPDTICLRTISKIIAGVLLLISAFNVYACTKDDDIPPWGPCNDLESPWGISEMKGGMMGYQWSQLIEGGSNDKYRFTCSDPAVVVGLNGTFSESSWSFKLQCATNYAVRPLFPYRPYRMAEKPKGKYMKGVFADRKWHVCPSNSFMIGKTNKGIECAYYHLDAPLANNIYQNHLENIQKESTEISFTCPDEKALTGLKMNSNGTVNYICFDMMALYTGPVFK